MHNSLGRARRLQQRLIAAALLGLTLTPALRSYSSVSTNQTAQTCSAIASSDAGAPVAVASGLH